MTAELITLPTPERLRKDKIEVAREQIQDTKGDIGRPFHVLDTLSLMEGVGSISKSMHAAGVRFMDDFSKAQLVTLRPRTWAGYREAVRPIWRIRSHRPGIACGMHC